MADIHFNALGFNEYRVEGELAYIKVASGHESVIDAADLELVRAYRWFVVVSPRNGVRGLRANVKRPGKVRKRTSLYIHRVITGAAPHLDVDHINHDTLDNRRSNLRVCTTRQNCQNRRPLPGRLKGVYPHSHGGWYAAISVNGALTRLGRFTDPVMAARAYDLAALEHFGEFACPNFAEAS